MKQTKNISVHPKLWEHFLQEEIGVPRTVQVVNETIRTRLRLKRQLHCWVHVFESQSFNNSEAGTPLAAADCGSKGTAGNPWGRCRTVQAGMA